MLYPGTLLFISFIYSSVYLLIPSSLVYPPHPVSSFYKDFINGVCKLLCVLLTVDTQDTNDKCESCFSSPSSSEKPCTSHKHSREKRLFHPALTVGEAEMTFSVSLGPHLVCAKGPLSPFSVSAVKAPWRSAFSSSFSLQTSHWILG